MVLLCPFMDGNATGINHFYIAKILNESKNNFIFLYGILYRKGR